MKLSGKVAVITGAARGIGRSCAERFLKEGAKVIVSDIDADGLARTASELVRPNDVRVVSADVAKRADVDRLVATAAREFGRIDIMVNNAGVARNQNLLEISEKDFDDVIAINLKGAFFGVQAAAKQMIAQGGGGVIINMSSVNALLAIPSLATYAISKGRYEAAHFCSGRGARPAQNPRGGGRAGDDFDGYGSISDLLIRRCAAQRTIANADRARWRTE
jgi:NAD(P)-dependent dehydrogenase (short-subunit alcohol dehydrogenase family)